MITLIICNRFYIRAYDSDSASSELFTSAGIAGVQANSRCLLIISSKPAIKLIGKIT